MDNGEKLDGKVLISNATATTGHNDIGNALADADVPARRYWLYSPGDQACKWEEFYERGVMGIGWSKIGDLRQYRSKEEMKAAMKEKIDAKWPYLHSGQATWQFTNEIKAGDIIFAKKGKSQIIGTGIVTSDYFYEPSDHSDYVNFRNVNWVCKGLWEVPGLPILKTLTDISSHTDFISKVLSAIGDVNGMEHPLQLNISYPPYTPAQFLSDVYMSQDRYTQLVGLLRNKKNIILQGAPGVGKTFTAKRLAYSMMGIKDQERVMMVQFHQSYTYEDFIEGFRPCSDGAGFELKKGSFYNFCKKAADDLENEYFFIIDEINRGNLSKIFGELFMLIEADKRGNALGLLYSDEKFFVPKNVYLIGMMNTADRSLALLDYALRRRFAFFELKPGFESDGFRAYQKSLHSAAFDRLIAAVEDLNLEIAQDETLGDGFCIGHSYFCNLEAVSSEALENIVEFELIPLLKEYWFDEPQKIKTWSNRLRSAIQ